MKSLEVAPGSSTEFYPLQNDFGYCCTVKAVLKQWHVILIEGMRRLLHREDQAQAYLRNGKYRKAK